MRGANYTHSSGQVLEDGKPITLAVASEKLAKATVGMSWGLPWTREVSRRHAAELKQAIAAAAIFNKLQARRGKSSTSVAVSTGDAA